MNTLEILHNPTSDSFFFIGGPCVIESREHAFLIAESLTDITTRLKIPFVFKASYDKANRTSGSSFRGVGKDLGLQILHDIQQHFHIPVTTDVHESIDVPAVAEVIDIIQIPAFLCRQTDLLVAAAESGKFVNIKKGQFLAPWDVAHIVTKLEAYKHNLMLTERGTSFGYNNLVVDIRSLPIMRSYGVPIVFDATHSLQLPGGGGSVTSGMREYIPHLARAAVGAGIDGLFMEIHDNPEQALSDASTQFPLHALEELLISLKKIHEVTKDITRKP